MEEPGKGAIPPGALAGLKVIDMASLYAAPLAATIMADFGADVLKIEPPEGDLFRDSKMWPLVARGKRCLALDLRSEEGIDRLKALAAQADVLVENYPAAVLERRGIGWEVLSAVNPRLVMLSVSCFGATGPYQGRPGSGTIGEGFGGLTFLTGTEDGPPMLPSVALGDAVGAMSAVIGTLSALYWRDRSGRGQQVDASLYEPILQIVAHAAQRWEPGRSPERCGSRLPGVLRNVYRTSDERYVAISASTARHAADLLALAGGQGDDQDACVAAWIATVPQAALVEQLVARRIPVTPVNSLDDMLADPHMRARGSLIHVADEALGDLALAAPAPRLSETPGRIGDVNPPLGTDADAALERWAGS
ncbi:MULTISPECIES: CaiB/BaiF CoA-transferase family protein [Sphingobium]|jgi:crotonobetainyl-CoA:carnitine CoA-transferase CaiB-like acyl-CoA transferase|uniref:CaiB/BaiF CoA transferase family protein n=1 Tax=Sphingobium TaxID=165695 RepID=UPI0010F5D835|nr:CoA transferase [Sphingobium sp. RSMS]UXC93547.1 CoA transferase [Sphingobium sp. RSMS]